MARILVVDDEKIIVALLEEYIKEMGHEIVGSAYSGEESIEMVRHLNPDIVLMDIVMPGRIDGVKAARIIKDENDVPVIFLTAHTDYSYIEDARIAEPYGYLVKPFKEHEIKAAIEIALYKKDMERRLKESEKEQKKATEALMRSEQFGRATIDALSAHICVLDETGKIISVNKAWREFAETNGLISHYISEGADYLSACDTATGAGVETAAQFAEGIRSVLRGERKEFMLEYPCHSPSVQRWFVGHVTRFTGDGPACVAVAHENITERKESEKKLRESEERYRTVIENSRDGIAIVSKGRHIFVNDRFAEMFGYENREKIIGRDHSLTVHPDDLELVEDINRKRQEDETAPLSYEFKGIKKNGTPIYIEVSATRIFFDGKSATLAYLRDVTEHKKLEDQLRQSQKLEAVGQLAGGIAHDFNNILTIIIGFASVLQMDMAVDSPSRAYVGEILLSAEKAANMIQNLLAFSRKQMINLKPVDMNLSIRRMKKLLSRLIGEDIEFKTAFSENDLIVMADSGQIDQVIMNIVTNSRDAMPHGGKLAISTSVITIDDVFIKNNGFGEKGEYALLMIIDNGIGMDVKMQERIFEPFFTTKDVGKGTGLGLSMVYGIISQHNGYITVESTPSQGTKFNIYLPLIKLEVKDDSAMDYGNIPSGGKETILLVEDEPGVRKFVKVTLERFGYKVIETKDGDDALNYLSSSKEVISLALIDLVMPKMNGIEVYEKIAEIKTGLPAIFMSGYSEDILQQKGLSLNELHYITKPITPNDLLKTVKDMLRQYKDQVFTS